MDTQLLPIRGERYDVPRRLHYGASIGVLLDTADLVVHTKRPKPRNVHLFTCYQLFTDNLRERGHYFFVRYFFCHPCPI